MARKPSRVQEDLLWKALEAPECTYEATSRDARSLIAMDQLGWIERLDGYRFAITRQGAFAIGSRREAIRAWTMRAILAEGLPASVAEAIIKITMVGKHVVDGKIIFTGGWSTSSTCHKAIMNAESSSNPRITDISCEGHRRCHDEAVYGGGKCLCPCHEVQTEML
jgi:hypothetical protein